MAEINDKTQEEEWSLLHDRITSVLDRYGRLNAFREGDYWLLDENWSWHCHQLEIQNLNLLRPEIIEALRSTLANHKSWFITVRVDVPGTEDLWPGMGVAIYWDQVVDDLKRDYLPDEIRAFRYLSK